MFNRMTSRAVLRRNSEFVRLLGLDVDSTPLFTDSEKLWKQKDTLRGHTKTTLQFVYTSECLELSSLGFHGG